jgi:hypothetical protein
MTAKTVYEWRVDNEETDEKHNNKNDGRGLHQTYGKGEKIGYEAGGFS